MNYDDLTREELIAVLQRRDALARYGLRWERDSIPQDKSLNRDFVGFELNEELSVGNGPWTNLVVEGDNFDALRHLVTTHAGQVKLIYIDPPYNTGRKDFVYNDSYFDASNRYRHSTWLEFMYQRLTLAKNLLAEDGVIFVSIDDNELFNLGLLMSQVFGEQNFVANVIWQKVYSPKNTAIHFSDDHEYVLVYAANRDRWRPNSLPRSAAQDKAYKNPDNDPRGPWKPGDLTARNYYGEGRYPITCPSGRVIDGPPAGRYWVVSQTRFNELNADSRIWWGKDGNNIPALKRFLSEVKQGVVPQTLWTYDEVGHTQDAKKQLNEILPKGRNEDVFSTPKPLQLMDRILRLATKPGDLVVDFFAGSGTLAQALLALNKEDGGQRRFVLVSSTEATVDEPERNLCRDVCAARVQKAIEGYENSNGEKVEGLGGNFAYVKATRVPMHRLEEGITDNMVWTFALEACRHPLTSVTPGFSASVHGEHMVAYCANVKSPTLDKLEAAITQHSGVAVVMTWAPAVVAERLAQHMHRIRLVSVPHDLRRAFKQGSVRDAQEEQSDSQYQGEPA
ncbi:site-specific DNA-methyltransferase [Burkholderia sp. 9779_493]|uniref:site-specific DNA-methyltransferase n=1 Tax=Burkholderia sp. 9779_493 TaxID=2751184 RepID=UPI001A3372BF|nr:site-specific DNA-methyltransferase [Burkholderia sp. 9779_493]MBG0868044.1 site-specific DNA-methyltransferase [Burkholderia sp. 9779_493]